MISKLAYYFGKFIRKVLLFPIKKNCKLSKTSKLDYMTTLNNVSIGEYSYVGAKTNITCASIGNYTSISSNCMIGGGEHPLDWVSTSPVFNNQKSILRKQFSKHEYNPYKKVIIGNDVWIGSNVCIKSGVEISDGAVIGMGSVVTKNVGPYEIWCGNPAKRIRSRFSEEDIDFLVNVKWWEWDEEKIRDFSGTFNNIVEFKERNNKK